MQEPTGYMELLKTNNYYLMTDAEGNEGYDEDGNLVFYHRNGASCLCVPNTEEIRKLYDLPLEPSGVKFTIRQENVTKPGNLKPILNSSEEFVWVGRHDQRSSDATKILIELCGSPKYQTLLQKPHTNKSNVWQDIASELEAKGYKLAANTREEAGVKVHQRWKNMETTCRRFMRYNPNELEEGKMPKKPYFFDDMSVLLLKDADKSLAESSVESSNEDGNLEEDCEEGDSSPENEPAKTRQFRGDSQDTEDFPRHALGVLTSLVNKPKYHKLLTDPSFPDKNRVWESIYMEMMKDGFKFGASIREGALILAEKWRLVEKGILNNKLCVTKALITPDFRKALKWEIQNRKALGPNYQGPPEEPEEYQNSKTRRPTEISPNAVRFLLKLINSEKYETVVSKVPGRGTKLWEKIFEEVQSKGYKIAGDTKKEKVSRLFQKWRNMKRAFVNYLIAKYKGKKAKKPMFYELMLGIFSKHILNNCEPDCKCEEEMEMDGSEEDSESDSDNSCDQLESSQMDHSYHNQPDKLSVVDEPMEANTLLPNSSPSDSSTAAATLEVLQQIKSLNETALAMQQQNFSKMISVLDNLVSQQSKLTAVISEYILSQPVKSESKKLR